MRSPIGHGGSGDKDRIEAAHLRVKGIGVGREAAKSNSARPAPNDPVNAPARMWSDTTADRPASSP